MKIYVIDVTIQAGMGAATIRLAYDNEDKASQFFNALGERMQERDQLPRYYVAKAAKAYIRGCDIVAVQWQEMQVQGAPMFQ